MGSTFEFEGQRHHGHSKSAAIVRRRLADGQLSSRLCLRNYQGSRTADGDGDSDGGDSDGDGEMGWSVTKRWKRQSLGGRCVSRETRSKQTA